MIFRGHLVIGDLMVAYSLWSWGTEWLGQGFIIDNAPLLSPNAAA